MRKDTLPMFEDADEIKSNTRWFSTFGCVYTDEGIVRVLISGFVVYQFPVDDVQTRNLAAVSLASEKKFKKCKIARAFNLSGERLRQLRIIAKTDGIEGLPSRQRGGSETKVSASSRKTLVRDFESGMNANQAFKKRGCKLGLSYRTICRVQGEWSANRSSVETVTVAPLATTPVQCELFPVVQTTNSAVSEAAAPVSSMISDDDGSPDESIVSAPVASRKNVRHAGSLLMIAMLHALGLHEAILRGWGAKDPWRARLRVAVDALIAALCIGEKCIEGVRRLRHPSLSSLLRTTNAPTANWVRRIFHKYVDERGAVKAHFRMTENYLKQAEYEEGEPAVFYVDNHMRPYTGKRRLQKGWRMQDKRVRKGTCDYYLHDEDGRPLFRVDVPMHGTLGEWLKPITEMLRRDLGPKQRILLAFDRGGAFPKYLASLRERGFEFVTYERGPYQAIPVESFVCTLETEKETLKVFEEPAELGDSKVEVRRIALLTNENRQVNVIAVSGESKERLVQIVTGRWVQENGFKHGNERWGANHLDGRKPKKYPDDHVIVNPARSRLERAMSISCEREGSLRRKLSRLKKSDAKYAALKSEIAALVAEQNRLADERKSTTKYELLKNTELADELVQMDPAYKILMDTIRIACINGEAELAGALRPFLKRPDEAKKILKNVFTAPGSIRVDDDKIVVAIDLVGSPSEKSAVNALLSQITSKGLSLPGDPDRRPIEFKSQL